MPIDGFILNSLPKSGTNLVCKVFDQFPGIRRAQYAEVRSPVPRPYNDQNLDYEDSVYVGIVTPIKCPRSVILEKINRIKRGQYSPWHVPYSDELKEIFSELQKKVILSIRDPRDILISQYFYAARLETHRLHNLSVQYDMESFLKMTIKGFDKGEFTNERLAPIAERIVQIILWRENYDSLLVRFEDLVGQPGGGNDEKQMLTIRNIACYLGLEIPDAQCLNIAQNLHGGTSTFRKGIIGDWRNYFTPNLKELFKENAGELLIKLGYESSYDW